MQDRNHSEFADILTNRSWDLDKAQIYATQTGDVQRVLQKAQSGRKLSSADFMTLISPAAADFLEEMAQLSSMRTKKRFGRTIQLYAPFYLSNECQNICTYCGFSLDNPMERKTLRATEILKEVEAIKALGYEHVLLVTGEANKTVGLEYFIEAFKLIKPHFSQLSLEVQPLDQHEYEALLPEGLHSVLVYQETYHKANYKKHHPKGKKSNFEYRLATPERLGRAGVHKIGIGVLIGLEDWRTDSFYTALHLDYLERTFWKTKYSISFPRLRPHSGGLEPVSVMSDRELVQLICAYRIFNEEVELSLSTREHPSFRDHVIPLGITSMSAGSKTNPGGLCLRTAIIRTIRNF